jgi:hypothetical protein
VPYVMWLIVGLFLGWWGRVCWSLGNAPPEQRPTCKIGEGCEA